MNMQIESIYRPFLPIGQLPGGKTNLENQVLPSDSHRALETLVSNYLIVPIALFSLLKIETK